MSYDHRGPPVEACATCGGSGTSYRLNEHDRPEATWHRDGTGTPCRDCRGTGLDLDAQWWPR